MDPIIAAIAALVGYLLGSISFARIVSSLVAPEVDISDAIEMDISGLEEPLRLDGIGGTAVAARLGERYGCLTAILDMLKVAVPTLAFRFAYPDVPYSLITAATGVVGHNWPLYHRFKGGWGLSAIYGGYLAVDPIGALITTLAATALGLLARNVLLAYSGGTWLMIPWLWFRTGDPAYLVYAVGVNLIYLVALIPDLRGMRDRRRRGVRGDFHEAMASTPMGRGMQKLGSRLGLYREKKP
jgi:glycerol-3-phosphate acyltransferase PlsY